MEERIKKARIIKLTENKYMVQHRDKAIWEYWVLMDCWINNFKEPVDLETAQAYLNLYKKDKEVIEEIEY